MQRDNQILLKDLFQLTKGIEGIDVAIAGGLNANNIEMLKNDKLDIYIVGSAITANENPRKVSREIADILSKGRS